MKEYRSLGREKRELEAQLKEASAALSRSIQCITLVTEGEIFSNHMHLFPPNDTDHYNILIHVCVHVHVRMIIGQTLELMS